MIYLLLSILFFSAMMIAFKFFERYNVNTLQAIVINYITASAFGFILSGKPVSSTQLLNSAWFPNAFLIGLMFIFLFYMIAVTAQRISVSVSAVATKMSAVIPATAAFFLYDDSVTVIKITGILLALVGVFLTSLKKEITRNNLQLYLLPAILFLGSGLLDTYIKYTESTVLNTRSDINFFVPMAFTVAAVTGGSVVLVRFFVSPARFSLNAIPWGMAVGLCNYASLFFLLKTLEIDNAESSVVFPVNNVGIVIIGTVASFLIFKEKLSRENWLGIICSLVAIILMAIIKI